MNIRKKRIELIIELITHHNIANQEQLATMLADNGFQVTQATLSRDLKMLKIIKVPDEKGEYCYVLPNEIQNFQFHHNQDRHNQKASQVAGVSSIAFSGPIAVLKTRNGYASAIAYDIDMSKRQEIIGTISGADTVFAALREDVSHEEAMEILTSILHLKTPLSRK